MEEKVSPKDDSACLKFLRQSDCSTDFEDRSSLNADQVIHSCGFQPSMSYFCLPITPKSDLFLKPIQVTPPVGEVLTPVIASQLSQSYVVLHPGPLTAYKRWPLAHWQSLITMDQFTFDSVDLQFLILHQQTNILK